LKGRTTQCKRYYHTCDVHKFWRENK